MEDNNVRTVGCIKTLFCAISHEIHLHHIYANLFCYLSKVQNEMEVFLHLRNFIDHY